jgi:hypothetical protein
MLTLDFWEVPIVCAIIANVWIHLLTAPGKIFESAEFYTKKIIKNKKANTVLFDCPACLAGQLSLWYVIIQLFFYYGTPYPIMLIFCSIFLGALFSKMIYNA